MKRLIRDELDRESHAALGLLLDTAQQGTHPLEFASILKQIDPADKQAPLFKSARRRKDLPVELLHVGHISMVKHFAAAARSGRVFLDAWADWQPESNLDELNEDDRHTVKCAAATCYEDAIHQRPVWAAKSDISHPHNTS